MDAANVYAVMNILSALWTLIVVVVTEGPTLQSTWDHTIKVQRRKKLGNFVFFMHKT